MALKPRLLQRFLAIGKWLLFFLLGVAIIWYSLQSIPADKWDEFVGTLRTARYWLFLPVFFILCLSHWLRAYRWRLLIEPLGKRPSTLNCFLAVMIGYLANLAVPRLGEVMRCTLLSRYERIKPEELVGTVVAERAFDVLSLGLVFLTALALQYDIVWQFVQSSLQAREQGSPGQPSQPFVWWLVGGLLVVALFLFLFKRAAAAKLWLTIKAAFKGLKRGVLSAWKLEQKAAFLLSSLGIWLLYVLGTWIGYLATAGTDHLGLEVAFTGLAFGSLGMILTPGGIGSYALFLAEALQQNGVHYELGYANGTLQWFAQFGVVILMGSLSFLLLPIVNRNTAHHAPHTNH